MKGFIKLLAVAALLCCVAGAAAQQRTTHREYIERYRQLAIDGQKKYGIPASIKMGQALLESGGGDSRLAREANNHFGIKCKSDWKGGRIYHDDDAPQECFRKYDSVEDSFSDHSEFLSGSQRYQGLFRLDPTDYKGWAHGLKQAGYATNPRYAELLIKLIEDHELYLLDSAEGAAMWTKYGQGASAPVANPLDYTHSGKTLTGYGVYHNNGADFVMARAGDTYKSVAKAVKVSRKKLYKLNDVAQGAPLREGEFVYITKKAKRSENGKLLHTVREGETLWSVSQLYGIRAKDLAKINRYDVSRPLPVGSQVRLR